MSLNKFDRDLDPLAELIHKTGHEEGDSMVIQFDHLIEIPFETEGIGDRRIQHPWARGVSVPIIEEYEGQMSGDAVHVEFSRDATLKFADIKQYRASFAQLDDKTVKLLWDEALKGDQFDEDDSDLEPVEEEATKDNSMEDEDKIIEDTDEGDYMDEDEFVVREYIYTFGARYANNTWALKFAAPVEIEVRDANRKHEKITVFGLVFHGRGRVYAIVKYKETGNGCAYDEKEFGYFVESEKSRLVDMLKLGNCGLFAFDRTLDKPEEESVFHRCPDMIRKYIRDNGHLSKGISKYVVKFKEPVEIRTGMREKSLALGMDCDEEHDDKLWVLLDSKTDAYGCPMIGFMELVDSERFKCCDHLEQGDAGTFDWENPEPQELEVDDSESAKMRETGRVECSNAKKGTTLTKNDTIMFFRNNSFDASKVKACPKCGAVNITFNHTAFDGGSYVSCCSCNYSPQVKTWAESDWEALKRWNDLPREEAPYKEEEKHENYLHVEIPEVKVKHGTVLRDCNGNSWIFLSDNLPTPEFRPLYRCCQKVEVDGDNTFNITTTKIEEGVTDEKEEDEYTARDLMLITKNAIMDDLAKLKPVVKNIIAECIKHATAQMSECEVAVDLGPGMTADKANKIEKILKDKGFRVHWKTEVDRHVFCIDWGFPVTELEAHQ